jgi:chaperonin GroES
MPQTMIDPSTLDTEEPMDSMMMDDPMMPEQEEEDEPITLQAVLMNASNVAEIMTDDELSRMASKVIDEYKIDKESRTDWLKRVSEAIDLAKQVVKAKSYPWPKASNIKYPLVTTAAIQFSARAYPAIVSGTDLVKTKVNGFDPDGVKRMRGARIGMHMSWQLLDEMKAWEEETDKMFMIMPIVGMCFRKTYFDSTQGLNVSKIVLAQNLVFNYSASSFMDLNRKTEELELYPHQITERIRSGTFIDFDFGPAQLRPAVFVGYKGMVGNNNDPDAPHLFLEQHRLYDLDGDGYPEPYICTVHNDSGKTVRVVPRFDEKSIECTPEDIIRIQPDEYYTKY